MKLRRLKQLDPNRVTRDAQGQLAWYDLHAVGVEGQGWPEESVAYTRLPGRARRKVRPPLWDRSRHAAGLCVRFATDTVRICADWTLANAVLCLDHMPASGCSGLDLYVRSGCRNWRWLGVGRATAPRNRTMLVDGLSGCRREYLLYLPLYNGLKRARLGLPVGATLEPLPPPTAKPVVFYGTSIVNGGCASRPGMAYPSIIGRRLNLPTINLGFDGNGFMESEVAGLLAELQASCFVLDPLPNNNLEGVLERMGPLVRTLRTAHPSTPIVLVENVTYQYCHQRKGVAAELNKKNAALRGIFKGLQHEGIRGIHYLPGAGLLGHDCEATVDGIHPTDVGFQRMAEAMEPVLRKALASFPGSRRDLGQTEVSLLAGA